MSLETKARYIKQIKEKLLKEEDTYETLSLQLLEIHFKDKRWEEVTSLYNICATKINFLHKQMEMVLRTGKILGESYEYDYEILVNTHIY